MKKRIQTPLMATVAALAVGFVSPALADIDCDKASSKFASAVASKPDQLLTLLAEAVAKNESCSCEVVQAAIKAVGADKAKVGDIVFTAVSVAPGMATTITECAVAAAPKATTEIKAALKSALSDKGSYSSGKEVYTDKNPKEVIDEPVDDGGGFDFGRAPLDVRGIYLLAPSPGGGFVTETVVEVIERIKRVERGGGIVIVDRDTDGDGIPDKDDPDIDGDGIPNDEDEFPFEPDSVTPADPVPNGD